LLDIGCGSLRAGRLFIPYLRPGNYFGIEPMHWLIEEGIEKEVGRSMVDLKRPTFSNDADFTLSTFKRDFDFILAQSIFSHTSPAMISRCCAEAKKVLKPDGVFAATYFEGPVSYEGSSWVVKADYTPERITELIEAQGLKCTPIDWRHPDPQQWILIHHPGANIAFLQPSDAEKRLALEERLAACEAQLMSMKRHPYVRVGLWLSFWLVRLRFAGRSVGRWVRDRLGLAHP
jgi:SAM-dependent methyltransferase